MKNQFLIALLLLTGSAYSQKKPLNHTVYDSWESISAKQLSNNGQWASFVIAQQEGNNTLYLTNTVTGAKIKIPRGEGIQFSADSKYAAFSIKPMFSDIRLAKIKKKKADDMPKDSLGIINLTSLATTKVPRVKSLKFPEEGASLLAYQLEKPVADTTKAVLPGVAGGVKKDDDRFFADEDPSKAKTEGTEVILKNLVTGLESKFKYVNEYTFSKDGKQFAYATTAAKKDKTAPVGVYLLNTEKGISKTLTKGPGNFKSLSFTDDGDSFVFLGEKSREKTEIKDFNIYYSSNTLDTAQILVDNTISGMPAKWALSSDGKVNFSKDGKRLFFGIAPIKKPKDTTLVDFENAKLDVWGYKDDYLQPMQLKNADREAKKSYLTAIEIFTSDVKVVPLTDQKIPDATLIDEGNVDMALASTDYGNRIPAQWAAETLKDYYLINTKTGVRKKILESLAGNAMASPKGKYILYFEKTKGEWFTYNVASGVKTQLTNNTNVKYVDEDNDVPDSPSPYGIAGWTEDDKAVLIYDKYDIWECSPDNKYPAKNITNGYGRTNKITFRYEQVDPESRFFGKKELVWLNAFNNTTKETGFYKKNIGDSKDPELVVMQPSRYSRLIKAKVADKYIYDKGNYVLSPNVYVSADLKAETKLSNTNPQQSGYNWGTAELVKWTTPKGYKSEGILYKPEDFDPNKKYPMIVYFYEKLSDGLYSYQPPAPTPSRLNIPYFVSNGYLVFAPDISYENGYPGRSAEEFINSGVESLKKNAWVDGSKIGIQGQSWGGYQVAHLITRTNMYAAAWAGAPVVNMTSAYGGIRWESGMNRQFQYEKTQSRIGATLWEKPELYIENSPLFSLPKVSTPVVIMSNDADGAVPWYQGIEMFTGLKRLGKPVWLLNYNNEAHNLVLRQNRKDIQIREQQFFDYYLKGAKAPVWMVGGIPAVDKGRTWGFELTDEKP
jgi:dipeptidyl aminopeptidase/acylaminoacyl peptidase